MKITIKKEYTGLGLDDYHRDGILKKAIKDQGFDGVYVVANTQWNGEKKTFFGLVNKRDYGYISPKANSIIYNLSLEKSTSDVELILEEE